MVSNHHAFLLVLTTFLPLATALFIALGQSPGRDRLSRWYALAGSLATLVLSLGFIGGMTRDPGEFTAGIHTDWMREFSISFTLGLDGLSGLMVLLTNLLTVVSVLASWTAIAERRKEFYAFLMTLQTGVLGTFLALDLVLFYIFWELMLVPLYFLIGIFGSSNRIYATMKFFLYTMTGSVLMLVGILALHFQTAPLLPKGSSFLLPELLKAAPQLPHQTQVLIFLAFFFAFAIKVPMFPFHTWLPDAHTEAPTAGSILLAGVLLKTGVYGFLRIAIPLFPEAAREFAPLILTLSLVGIVYGALTAFAQTDMKRLVAYSSVSHMGFITLGIFSANAQAVQGAALQMVNHGLSTGALFLCVGILYERRHTRLMSEFGGLAHRMKVYAVLTVIVALSSAGLPGLNGFVGEFLILLGTFQTHPWRAALASSGVVLAAVYLLRMIQETLYGPLKNPANDNLPDLNFREVFSLVVLLFFAFWIGLGAGPYLKLVEPISDESSALLARDAAQTEQKQATRSVPRQEIRSAAAKIPANS